MEKIFETEHLVIRKFTEDDAKVLYENHLEEEVKQWIPNESYTDLAEAEKSRSDIRSVRKQAAKDMLRNW